MLRFNSTHLFCQVWTSGLVPSDWRDGILVALYKGLRTECSNYRPITLLSVPGKVFAHVLLARLQPLLDATRRPEQSGFVTGRSTIDAILALRLLSELHREFDRPLNVAYLDIKAAFDSVDRLALWKALRGRGVPDTLLDLNHQPTRKHWCTSPTGSRPVTMLCDNLRCETRLRACTSPVLCRH